MGKPWIRPRRWKAPRDQGLAGITGSTGSLDGLTRWELDGSGPEDVAVAPDGTVYTGLSDGRIMRLMPPDGAATCVAQSKGRPLGIEIDADGTLIVCDAHAGLLRIDPATGSVATLVDAVDGVPLRLTNNAAICPDGSVVFSETSTRFPLEHFTADLLEHSCTGRLLRWRPDGSTEVLLTGLAFANGVALAPDTDSVLVAETGAYRIRRLWLNGAKAGESQVLVSNLPGFPDNLSSGADGITWVAIASVRNHLLDALLPLPGLLRQAIWALPARLQPQAHRIALVIGFDAEGEIVHCLRGSGDRYHYVTGMREHDGMLYLGSLADTAIARIALTDTVGTMA